MNIGIITIQGLNHGSFLQGYALKEYLETRGHTVSFINTMEPRQLITSIDSLYPLFEIQKQFTFISAWKNQATTISHHHYDAIIIGSDIVWATNTPIYYGSGVNTQKTLTYAPCATISTDLITPENKKRLKNIPYHSARDEYTAALLRAVTGKKPPIVADPAFLIDWKHHEQKDGRQPKKYTLIYSYSAKSKMLRKTTYTLPPPYISIGNHHIWCHASIPTATPQQFLTWIKNAAAVITDTYHGTVFSIIYKKPFASFPKSHKTCYQLKQLNIPSNTLYANHGTIQKKIRNLIQASKKYIIAALQKQE